MIQTAGKVKSHFVGDGSGKVEASVGNASKGRQSVRSVNDCAQMGGDWHEQKWDSVRRTSVGAFLGSIPVGGRIVR